MAIALHEFEMWGWHGDAVVSTVGVSVSCDGLVLRSVLFPNLHLYARTLG